MNRDELRTRGPERPPAVFGGAGGRPAWMGPIDSDSGGTWMGASDRGLVACLTNRYAPGDPEQPTPSATRPSRGGIVPAVLACSNADAAREFLLSAFAPTGYAPFDLIVCSLADREQYTWRGTGAIELTEWSGRDWREFSSSSWNTAEVLAWRSRQFAHWVATGARHVGHLPAHHLLQPAGRGAWSPLVSRPTAVTRSITQAVVDADAGEALLRYWPDPTPQTAGQRPAAELRLPLRRSA